MHNKFTINCKYSKARNIVFDCYYACIICRIAFRSHSMSSLSFVLRFHHYSNGNSHNKYQWKPYFFGSLEIYIIIGINVSWSIKCRHHPFQHGRVALEFLLRWCRLILTFFCCLCSILLLNILYGFDTRIFEVQNISWKFVQKAVLMSSV